MFISGAHATLQKGTVTRYVGLLTLLTIVFDEVAYNIIFLLFFGRRATAVGRVAKGALHDDCLICHGAGLDNRSLGPLEFYCDSPRHVSHRYCMNCWLSSRRQNAFHCPACRQRMQVRTDFFSLSLNDLLAEMSWGKLFSRSLVTLLCVVLVSFLTELNVRRQHKIGARLRSLRMEPPSLPS